LEDHTGATISLNVSYQNEVFTKLNYEDAAHIFQKRKDRKKRRISPVPVKVRRTAVPFVHYESSIEWILGL